MGDPQVEHLDGGRVRLTVEVEARELEHAVAHAAHDLAEHVKIPGFRAGRVPPEVLLPRIGKERLYTEAVESHISNWFWSAARVSRVRPADLPEFDYELPEGEDEPWVFRAEFPVQGPVDPADWSELEVPRLEVEVEDEIVDSGLEALQGSAAALAAVEGRPARSGDVAVVDILSEAGVGQRSYVVELGAERLVEELERGIGGLLPGESSDVSWRVGEDERRGAVVTLRELYEKVLPPLDDELARAASEFDTLEELRGDIFEQITTLLQEEVESRFRTDAVDELVKASSVEPAPLVVEVRTRELLNTFFRQIEQRGIDPVAYLKMAGISGEELTQTLRNEAALSLARELVLEGVADKLALEVSDEDLRGELREGGDSDEEIDQFLASALADRVRGDLRLRRAAERVAAEVKPISPELAEARERLWMPEKEATGSSEKKLWIPGSKDE